MLAHNTLTTHTQELKPQAYLAFDVAQFIRHYLLHVLQVRTQDTGVCTNVYMYVIMYIYVYVYCMCVLYVY